MTTYITDIQTNIKFPGSLCLSGLSKNLFISGPNGSGKTALINALELALTGEARDLGGRDKAKSSKILEGLLHPHEDSLFAVVKLSDGRSASWVMERGKRPKHQPVDGDVHFLLPELLGALKGSKAVTARFLVNYFGRDWDYGPIDQIRLGERDKHNDILNARIIDGVRQAVDPTTSSLPPHLQLLRAEEYARKAQLSHAAEARSLKVALERLGVMSEKGAEHADKALIVQSIITLLDFQVQNNLGKCGVCASEVDLKTLGGRLAQAQAQLDRLGGAPSSDRVAALQRAYNDSLEQSEDCKAIAKACMEKMYKLIEKNARRISSQITESLPLDFPYYVGLEVTGSSILIGFYAPEDEFLRSHVSGAELVTLCTALGGAIAQTLPPQDLIVLTTPDRGVDLNYLRRLLNIMKSIPAVTVIQNPFQPRGRPPADWTRIVLDEEGAVSVHGGDTTLSQSTQAS
tara:strand:+ start:1243 stop:2622 length:1380 start_codon:yes stop_codon:yes gene_type:complete